MLLWAVADKSFGRKVVQVSVEFAALCDRCTDRYELQLKDKFQLFTYKQKKQGLI